MRSPSKSPSRDLSSTTAGRSSIIWDGAVNLGRRPIAGRRRRRSPLPAGFGPTPVPDPVADKVDALVMVSWQTCHSGRFGYSVRSQPAICSGLHYSCSLPCTNSRSSWCRANTLTRVRRAC
jgi:hypothetical protein